MTYFEFDERHLDVAKRSRENHFEHHGNEAAQDMQQDDGTPPELEDILKGGVVIVKARRLPVFLS